MKTHLNDSLKLDSDQRLEALKIIEYLEDSNITITYSKDSPLEVVKKWLLDTAGDSLSIVSRNNNNAYGGPI